MLFRSFFKGGDEHPRSIEDWVKLQKEDETCIRLRALVESGSFKEDDKKQPRRDDYKIDDRDLLLIRHGNVPRDRDINSSTNQEGGRWTVVTPQSCRAFVMYRYHTLPMSGHHGRDNTIRNIKRQYYWRCMRKDIGRWIRACATCRKRKECRQKKAGVASSVSTATHPFDTIEIGRAHV